MSPRGFMCRLKAPVGLISTISRHGHACACLLPIVGCPYCSQRCSGPCRTCGGGGMAFLRAAGAELPSLRPPSRLRPGLAMELRPCRSVARAAAVGGCPCAHARFGKESARHGGQRRLAAPHRPFHSLLPPQALLSASPSPWQASGLRPAPPEPAPSRARPGPSQAAMRPSRVALIAGLLALAAAAWAGGALAPRAAAV